MGWGIPARTGICALRPLARIASTSRERMKSISFLAFSGLGPPLTRQTVLGMSRVPSPFPSGSLEAAASVEGDSMENGLEEPARVVVPHAGAEVVAAAVGERELSGVAAPAPVPPAGAGSNAAG